MRAGSLARLSGRDGRNPIITGTSPFASVAETKVWQLAFLPRAEAYCGAPHRARPLFRQRRVVDYQHGLLAADQPFGLYQQLRLQRRCIPDTGGNEVVQLIVVAGREARRHRLHALALARPDRARNMDRAHPPPCLVVQTHQERLPPRPP